MVHYFFFSLAGPRDKQVVFAIRAELGLTPQMDVGPYAYDHAPYLNMLTTALYLMFAITLVCLCYKSLPML